MNEFLWTITGQYILFVSLACIGVLQLAGARSASRRLYLLPERAASAALGCVLLLSAYAYFFTQAGYLRRGLEGAQLFAYFVLGAILALLLCLAVSTVRMGKVGTARHRLSNRVRASVAQLKPLFARRRGFRTKEEAR